MLHCLVFKYIL